jgi:hypothetical protein
MEQSTFIKFAYEPTKDSAGKVNREIFKTQK